MNTKSHNTENHPLVTALWFGTGCFVVAVVAYLCSFPTATFPTIWFPSGVALVVFLHYRYNRWPALIGAGILAIALASLAARQPLLPASLTTLTTILEAAMGAWLVRRFDRSGNLQQPSNRLWTGLLFSALISAGTSAFIVTTVTSVFFPSSGYLPVWQIVYISRLLGMLSVAPVLVTWWDRRLADILRLSAEQIIELCVLITGLVVCLLFIYIIPNSRQNYLIIPFLVWAALRFGLPGVALSGLLVTVSASLATINQVGAFATSDASIAPTMVNLGVFLIITLVTCFILAALWNTSRRIEKALRESEGRYRLLVENQGEGIGILDDEEVFQFANPAAAQIFGVAAGSLEGHSLREFTTPEQFAIIRHQTALRKTNQKTAYEIEITKPGGQVRSLLVNATAQLDVESGVTGTFIIFHDNTNRKQAEITLRDSRARYQTLFDHSPIPIWEEDFSRIKLLIDGLRRDGVENFREYFDTHPEQVNVCVQLLRIIDVNQAGMHIFDYSDKSKFFVQVPNMVHRGPSDVFIEELVAIADGKKQFDFEGPNDIIDGVIRYHHVRWTVAPGYENDYRRVIVTINDVTERRQAEESMRYLSTHDLLTGLYNRNFFEAELERLEHSRQEPINIMVVDVNGMKQTNDTLGHAVGDDLLRRTAQVLKLSFRTEDILARIGGDEFVVLFHGNIPVEQTIIRVKSVLFEHNHWYQGPPLSLAIGAASGNKGSILIELFKKADQQMYKEKIETRHEN